MTSNSIKFLNLFFRCRTFPYEHSLPEHHVQKHCEYHDNTYDKALDSYLYPNHVKSVFQGCLLYTSDAADE